MEMMERDSVLEGFITLETEKGPRAVGALKKAVVERAQETQRKIYDVFHLAVDMTSDAKEWSDDIHYDDSIVIDTISQQKSAAGTHNLVTRVTTLDIGALKVDRDEGYWNRVEAHEGVHETQHTAVTQGAVLDQEQDILLQLVEWHAITESGQPDNDLTPEYVSHRQKGEEIAALIGAETIKTALRDGDLQGLQDTIGIARAYKELGIKPETEFATAA